jgi:hypothetical protein
MTDGRDSGTYHVSVTAAESDRPATTRKHVNPNAHVLLGVSGKM